MCERETVPSESLCVCACVSVVNVKCSLFWLLCAVSYLTASSHTASIYRLKCMCLIEHLHTTCRGLRQLGQPYWVPLLRVAQFLRQTGLIPRVLSKLMTELQQVSAHSVRVVREKRKEEISVDS